MKLLIVSHVVHYRHAGGLFAYGPYAREVELWCDLFSDVTVAAPWRTEEPPGDCLPLRRDNIRVHPLRETGGTTWTAKAKQLLALPGLVAGLSRAMVRADAIHVRCPGNLGLLGALLGPIFSRRLVCKYAGQWTGYPGEPRTVRWQRTILSSRWWRGPVTVYGNWPHQPPHVVPFFTSMLTDEHLEQARTAARQRQWNAPLRVLYVGRLSAAKHVETLIAAVGRLRSEGIKVEGTIIGHGPERAALEAQIARLGLQDHIRLAGGLRFEEVLTHYARAHALVLVSETEGWPKAIAEAMAFGLVCVGTDRGLVPSMLGEGRGLVAPPGDAAALAAALRRIAADPEAARGMSARAAAWGQQYSLSGMKTALAELLAQHWGVPLEPVSELPSVAAEVGAP